MPPGLIHEQNGMGARRHLRRDFIEMPLHGLGVAAWQDEGRADTPRGTDGPEDPGRLCALILEGSGPGCEAWNKLIEQPWKIMSIGSRKWAMSSN